MFPAPAGAEVEIFAACGTEAFAVLLAEELRLHIQNEAGFENFAEVYPVALQSEELRIVTGVLLHDDGVKRGHFNAFELTAAAVADADHLRHGVER